MSNEDLTDEDEETYSFDVEGVLVVIILLAILVIMLTIVFFLG